MNSLKRPSGWKTTVAAVAGGTMLASSCTTEQLKAVLAGVEVVAGQLGDKDDDVSFGDWLSAELDD